MNANARPTAPKPTADSDKAIRESLRRLIEEAKSVKPSDMAHAGC